jgi:CRISPR-associated protein Cmr5
MMIDRKDQTRRQNTEQERGRQAWLNIREIKDKDKSNEKTLEKEYRSLARGLNAMIQINGLGQTLGFLKAKGKGDTNKAHYLLLNHLTTWMQSHFKAENIKVMNSGHDGLLRWVTDEATSSADYRRATTECLAFGAWLRRFAEAELKEPDSGAD